MKKIALIHDLSSFGKCSLTAAIPVISALGIQACPLPTAILSSQTGFSSFFYDDYTDKMNSFTNEWKKLDITFDGIYSGYLGSYEQINKVLYFLDNFKTANNLYIADPVMGDNGKRIKIFSDKLLSGMKELCRISEICTPNLTELCLITDTDYDDIIRYSNSPDYIHRISDLILSKMKYNNSNNHTVIVTGIVQNKNNSNTIGNLIIETQNYTPLFFESLYTGKSFSGTGDLFTSVVCGALVNGMSTSDAVKLAINFLKPAIDEATLQNIPPNHGVNFEKYLKLLINN